MARPKYHRGMTVNEAGEERLDLVRRGRGTTTATTTTTMIINMDEI